MRVRSYNFIRGLTAHGHHVTVVTVPTTAREHQSIEELKKYCASVHYYDLPRWRSMVNVVQALPGRTPLQSAYSWHPALAKEIAQLITQPNGDPNFDVIHVEHLRGARYGLSLQSLMNRYPRQIPVIWDSVDSISLLFRQAASSSRSWLNRWITRFELRRTERFESQLVGQFDRVLVTSPKDREALLSLSHSENYPKPVSVLRNGVDLTYFKPDEGITRDPATLVVSGKMSYHANNTMALHLVQDIMPHIWSVREDVKVWIVGKDPSNSVKALSKNAKVIVTGTVKDIRPYITKATIAVAPIAYGAGIQNKVLEAMACGTPVVASPQAISALEVTPGRDLHCAKDPLEFARAVVDLLDDPDQRKRMGENGYYYVQSHHQWSEIVSQLELIYVEAIREHKS